MQAMTHVDDLGGIAAAHGLYPVAAYAFVAESLRESSRQHEGSCACSRHLSAGQLVDGLLELATERFGLLAPLVLRSWGLRSSDDVGRVTFHLVEHGVFGKQADDRPEDFAHGPDFARRVREVLLARL
jgi:uncharacterized repeat protein (TIGR04138 family)